jgi:Zn-dependent alcohol dehydrogenase
MSPTATTAAVVETGGAPFELASVELAGVVACSYASCGACATCTTGRPFYCAEFLERNSLATRTDGYDFDEINQAADDALDGEVVKPVLRMS